MEAKPLKKSIYDKAKEIGIEKIILRFSGGNDEGYLDVEVEPPIENLEHHQYILDEIQDWAWDVYSYSGAGEGNSYGDDIYYDIKNGKVSTECWYNVVKTDFEGSDDLKIEDEEIEK